ncbi:hypothetical protein [Agromyces sp. NPDC058064]|uniref:hypothetical protein n=1 Tax=Agromyces sp. NPDC058064 TaxID=3346322 RepID=UPI0036DCC058
MTATTVAEPAETPAVRAALWRRLVGSPLIWAAVCLALTVPWFLAGQGMEFVPYLLMLVGGWLCGFAFVNATLSMTPARTGAVVHVLGAVIAAAFVWFAVDVAPALLEAAPEWVAAGFVILQFAAIPASAWIWLGLISRATAAIGARDARRAAGRPARVTPEWERATHGRGSAVRFAAVPLRMSTLTGIIIAITLVGGILCTVALIAVDDVVMNLGPRFAIVFVGVFIALPAYLLFRRRMRARTVDSVVEFGDDELRLVIGADAAVQRLPYRDLELLVWRARSDYARLEVRGSGLDVSLVAGVAAPRDGFTAELPPLSRRVIGRLQDLGLTLERRRRGEVLVFRPGGAHRP